MSPKSPRPVRPKEKWLWGAVGAGVGFIAGALLGAASKGGGGDSPGMAGFVIMAPTGAVLGGLIGASTPKASRK